MGNNERINEKYDEGREDCIVFGRRRTVIDRKTDNAFIRATEKLHKGHSELNRTLTLPFILMLACVIVAAFALRQFIAEPTMVDGPSMQTTLMDAERVFVEKVSYWFREPKRGDVVIVKYPGRWERFVKRVIALPGETIEIRDDGFVYIDGERLDESAYAGDWYGGIYKKVKTVGSVNGSYTVPEGYYFVVGDNRNVSHDSRDNDVGPIPAEDVLGRVRAVVWPLSKIRSVSK
ncbi:MAG: signal peptidase I [Clostridia bacterium]|nr:signal peptidase I [Clostridia bacterium]